MFFIYWLNAVLYHISIKIKILLDSFKCPLLVSSALCIKHFVTSIIINNQFCIVLLPDSEEAHFWHFCRNWLPQSIKALARAANSIVTHWLHFPPKFQYKTTPAFFLTLVHRLIFQTGREEKSKLTLRNLPLFFICGGKKERKQGPRGEREEKKNRGQKIIRTTTVSMWRGCSRPFFSSSGRAAR